MSSYNSQGYHRPDSSQHYRQESNYPRQLLEVQIPRLPYNETVHNNYESSLHDVHGGQQTHYIHQSQQTQQAHASSQPPEFLQTINPQILALPNRHSLSDAIVYPPETSIPPGEYSLMLLSLAEEYFEAAQGRELHGNPMPKDSEPNDYHTLIASGLGCLALVLKVCAWYNAPI